MQINMLSKLSNKHASVKNITSTSSMLVHVYLISYFMDYTQRQIWQYSKAQMVPKKRVILNT